MRAILYPSEISGRVAAPPSKSMAHRALICAALAKGESRVLNLSASQDITATLAAMRLLGASAADMDAPECRRGGTVSGCVVGDAAEQPHDAFSGPFKNGNSKRFFLIPEKRTFSIGLNKSGCNTVSLHLIRLDNSTRVITIQRCNNVPLSALNFNKNRPFCRARQKGERITPRLPKANHPFDDSAAG